MSNQSLPIAWGKPSIYIRKTSETAWKKIPTPVKDSTQLTPTKGDKTEAQIEGGEAEAVRFNANSYELAYAIRLAAGRAMPIEHVNGVVDDEYCVVVVPENPLVPGPVIMRSAVSVEDPINAADGSNWVYTHSCLLPEGGGKIVKWGVITATEGTGQSAGTFTLSANGNDYSAATALQ